MNLSLLTEKVIPIAIEAGKKIMEIYNTKDFQVEYKEDDSPLTIADKASNDILNAQLSVLTPHIPIISEENDAIAYEDRKDFSYCWVLDPLDGTKEFVARNGDFAVNIALIHFGKPVLGIICVPVLNIIYWAVKDGGSYRIENGIEEKIMCNDFNINDLGLRVPVSRSSLNEATKQYISRYNEPVLLPRGSALKFMNIAEGSADIYPRIGTTMEWDTAAPQIIIEEAGGKLLDMITKLPFVYNRPSHKNPDFLAMGICEDAY
jgi:3'(2'), 5'-bisphosphate nucleotidase